MNANSLRDLLQQAVDRRNAQGHDASFRALQEAVEAEENSRPRGLSLNRTTASQIVRGSYKGEPSDGTIRAIGWLAGVDDEDAFAAAGRRSPGLPFAEELPPGVNDLSPKERRAAIEMLRTLVAQRREINRHVDSSSGTQEPEPPRETNEDQKTFAVLMVRPGAGPVIVFQEHIGAMSEEQATGMLERTLQLAGFDTARNVRVGDHRIDIVAKGTGIALYIEVTPDDPDLVERADETLREAVGTRGKSLALSRRSSGRRLDLVRPDSSDDALRVSEDGDPSADSTSNLSDEVEDRRAARRGQGKTKGEQLRDRDAQLGEGPDPEGPEEGA